MKGVEFVNSAKKIAIPLLEPLFDDVAKCDEMIASSDTQFARRSYVRASFAFHEGYLFWFKGHLTNWLLSKGWHNRDIEITKIMLLSDSTYRPDRQGRIEEEPNRLPFLNHCAFVIRSACECRNKDAHPLFADNGWNEMQIALKVRHRITHPKTPEDLEVTRAELDSVRESHRWLFNCVAEILDLPEPEGQEEQETLGDKRDAPPSP